MSYLSFRHWLVAGVALLAGLAGRAHAAEPFSDYLVQSPKLVAPERGSVAGAIANLAFPAGSMSRGSFELPIPISLPSERGAVLADVLPSYSPDAGQSEWGMGWRVGLAIQRSALIGDIQLAGDEFVSPWGRLVAGSEGRYYVTGQAPQLVLRRVDGGWEAVDEDGTKFSFAASDSVAGGYAWMLSRVETVLGEHTAITYECNASGRPFLTTVAWGGRGDQQQYRADLTYESVTVPIEDYRSGRLLSIDRRVREVRVGVRSPLTGSFEEAWTYRLDYTASPNGAAFYLTGVTKTYRSGSTEPTQRYDYDYGTATIASAALVDVPALDAVLTRGGNNTLLPDKAVVTDIDEDGEPDFELGSDQTLVHQHGGIFTAEALPDNPDSTPLCRPPVNTANTPRLLARMTADANEPQAIRTSYNSQTATTRLLVCSRQGVPLSDLEIEGPWPLGANVRLVDLNHDQRPDLIRLFSRGYQVAENTSGPGGHSFVVHPAGPVTQSFTANSTWIQDMNGDGQADLVTRLTTSLMVWYGLGNFQFSPTGRQISLKSVTGGSVLDLAQRQLTFFDVNRDGLMDVLTTRGQSVNLFINNGLQLREFPVPALTTLNWAFGVPVVADVTGSGNFALMFVRDLRAKALQLTTPSTGLLVGAHDGKGTDISFAYARSAPTAGIGRRPIVLDTLTVASSGYDTVAHHYDYGAPIIHSVGKHLVGFVSADKLSPLTREHIEFINDDEVAGVPVLSEQLDDRTPGIVRFTRSQYDDIDMDGVRWLRPALTERGHRSAGVTLSTTTQYATYERGFCPTVVVSHVPSGVLVRTTTLASVATIADELHCLPNSERLLGAHTDASLDFNYLVTLKRNDAGQVTHATQFGSSMTPLVLQDVSYDAEHRVKSVSAPGRGTSTLNFDPAGRLTDLTDPLGITTQASSIDPVTDAVLELQARRPDAASTAYFAYDDKERLQASWDDLSGGSSAQPLASYAYHDPTSAAPGRIESQTLADASAGVLRNAISVVGADGELLVAGTWLGDHFALGTSSIASRNTLATHKSFIGALTADALAAMTSDDLRELGVRLDETVEAGFGHVVESTTTQQTDVVGTTTSELVMGSGEMVMRVHKPGGFSSESAVDAAGNLVRKLDENGVTYRYAYDALGRLVHLDTPDGGHTLRLDSFGRPTRVTREGVGSVTYEYDPSTGLAISKQHLDALGVVVDTTVTQYDAVGRPIQLGQTAAGHALGIAFDYDGQLDDAVAPGQLGRLTRVRGAGWERRTLFDPLGRMYQYQVKLDGWRELTCEKSYRADGSVATDTLTIRDSAGAPKLMTSKVTKLDSLGRVHALEVDGAVLYTLSYDNEGRLDRADFASGDSITFAYDPATHERLGYELQSAASSGGVAWERDPRGLVAAETYTSGSTTTRRAYAYDGRGALLSATGGDPSSYSYTPSGLPDQISDLAGSRSVHHTNSQLTVGDVSYTWDAAGRVVGKGEWTFQYGANGQLVHASRAGRQIDFVYDEADNRLLKRVDGMPVRADVAGGVLTEGHFIELVSVGGVVVGYLDNGQFTALLTDPRGTPFARPDGTTNVASPYGVRARHLDISEIVDYARLGWDPDLDLVRMGVRDYDAKLSQFIAPDPLYLENVDKCQSSPLQCSLYGYAGGNPVSFVDPSGMEHEECEKAGCHKLHEDLPASHALNRVSSGPVHPPDENARSFFGAVDFVWKYPLAPVSVPARGIHALSSAIVDMAVDVGLGPAGGDPAHEALVLPIRRWGPAVIDTAVTLSFPTDGVSRAESVSRDLHAEALAARDTLVKELALQRHPPATVVGAYSPASGRVTAAASRGGGMGCAEGACSELLGSPPDIQFTTAVRPRTGQPVDVCPTCEITYGRSAFPDPATRFKTDRVGQ